MKIEEQLDEKIVGLLPFYKKLVGATFATNILFIVEYDFSGHQLLGLLAQAAFLFSCLAICFYYVVTERIELVNINKNLANLSVKFVASVDQSKMVSLVSSVLAITLALFANNAYLGAFWILCFILFFVFVYWVKKIENTGDKIQIKKVKTQAAQPPVQHKNIGTKD